MNNKMKCAAIAAAAFVVGFGFNNFAMSDVATNCKMAVVDVNAVVAKSQQVKDLKVKQEAKIQELQTWLKTAKEDIAKQQTKEGKEKLTQKYDADLAKKKEAINSNYQKELKKINESISATIAQEAKTQNYNIVLAKGSVLYGGIDITKSITKVVK